MARPDPGEDCPLGDDVDGDNAQGREALHAEQPTARNGSISDRTAGVSSAKERRGVTGAASSGANSSSSSSSLSTPSGVRAGQRNNDEDAEEENDRQLDDYEINREDAILHDDDEEEEDDDYEIDDETAEDAALAAALEQSLLLGENARHYLLDERFQDFLEGIEPFFERALKAIQKDQFNLAFAKDFLIKLRAIGQRTLAEGLSEQQLEDAVVNRTLGTVTDVIDAVNLRQEELYDPRQTLAYLFCGMSVFACTVRLGKKNNNVVFHLSPAGNLGYSQIPELIRFCAIKTQFENQQGLKNVVLQYRFLLDLATWLEADRPAVSHLIANKLMPSLGTLVTQTRAWGVPPAICNDLHRLWDVGIVVAASALVRFDLVREAKDLYRLLLRVDISTLPPNLATRHAFVHAKLLQSCGEFANALERAHEALKGVTDAEEKQEIERLTQQLQVALHNANLRRYGPCALDEKWLSGAHVVPTETRTIVQDAILDTHRSRPKKKAKTKPVARRGETPSPSQLPFGRLASRGSSSTDLRRDHRDRLTPAASMPDLSQARNRRRQNSASSFTDTASESGDSPDEDKLIIPSDLDDTDEDEDDVSPALLDKDILFVNDYPDEEEAETHDTKEQPQQQRTSTKRRSRSRQRQRKTSFSNRSSSQASSGKDELDFDYRPVSEEAEDSVAEEEKDWFDASVEGCRPGVVNEDEDDTVELSEKQATYFNKPGNYQNGRPPFYPELLVGDKAAQLLRYDPDKYKRCQLKIERSHKAIAKVLDRDKYTEILIEGRSKANRCYMDDEVVVEILAEPDKNHAEGAGFGRSLTQQDLRRRASASGLQSSDRSQQRPHSQQRDRLSSSGGASGGADRGAQATSASVDRMVHGRVVGLLKRVNFANVDYPIMFCTLDSMEGHLMRPLCKTVPKIHVLNERVRSRYPLLRKHRVEVNEIRNGEVVFRRFCDVRPDLREQYVFKVALLGWRQGTIYPLGAVLEAQACGRKYSAGLKVLSMKHRVPKFYPRAVVEETKLLAQPTSLSEAGREDLTGERIFTIDPPGSRDLDDAISIKKDGNYSVVGVHIADVAATVIKDSAVDLEARRRAVTYYPLDRKPHPMLPEPLSHNLCSLLPNKKRLAFSVFFKLDAEGKQVSEPQVKRTVIRSRQQLTYEEVQKVIVGDCRNNVEPDIREDILAIYSLTAKLREARRKASMFFVPFDDPRLPELVKESNCEEAHSLIEELMVLTNTYIAKRMTRRPRYQNVMMVRVHEPPSWEELAQWQEKEGSVADLVLQLQEKSVTPNRKLSLDKVSSRGNAQGVPQRQETVVVQSEVWAKICRHLENGEVSEAKRLAFADSLHPLQCLAASRWMELMEKAEYKCHHGLNPPEIRHFGLDVDVYCHFTSPIRRYADLHVHRLLHADLDGRSPDCTRDDVVELALRINGATSRQKAFGKGCLALKVAESLQRQPLVFKAFVDQVDTEQLTVVVPSLLKVPDRKQELPFNMLGVSAQPELVTDTVLRRDRVTVAWKRRFYNEGGVCPPAMKSVWDNLDRQFKRRLANPAQQGNRLQKKNNAYVMFVSPDQQLTKHVRQADWAHIVKTLATAGRAANRRWREIPKFVKAPVLLPEAGSDEAGGLEPIEVEHVTSEKGSERPDGRGAANVNADKELAQVAMRPTIFKRVYTRGQVVQIQMSAEPRNGMLTPRVEMMHITKSAAVCTPHVSDPVTVLTTFATRSVRERQFSGYAEYARDWMPLLEMEAAVEAGNTDGSVVIENLPVLFKAQSASAFVQYRGTFKLGAKYCFERNIEFGGRSSDTIEENETDGENNSNCISFPLDYLCIRYKTQCSETVASRAKESGIVDKDYTWLAHGSVVRVNHVGKKLESGGHLIVTFALSPTSPPPPAQLLKKEGAKVTVEILPKSEVDRRCQAMLIELSDKRCTLGRAIAFGSEIPELDKDHKTLGALEENHEIREQGIRLPTNNQSQRRAIKMALTKSLSLIQGPPGTGKTATGVKLVYFFSKINRELAAQGKGKKTVLYCGPSNKSVDLVARELKQKLAHLCPKVIRMYGSAIERKDYPIPKGDLRSSRNLRDLNSDPELQDITLHHVIREFDKPYAETINKFDRYFEKCIKDPIKYPVTSKDLKAYRKLITKASMEELANYEVILTTCSVGGNHKMTEGTGNSIFQVIIDECAMSTEPQSMVPIVATRAEQVVLIGDHMQLRPIIRCPAAAELGLDQSLFERLFHRFPAFRVFLNVQYRMHPSICSFPSKTFYHDRLDTGLSRLWAGDPLPFWTHLEMADVVPKVVPHLLCSILIKHIKQKNEIPVSVASSMLKHLVDNLFLPYELGSFLKPYLFQDVMPRHLVKKVIRFINEEDLDTQDEDAYGPDEDPQLIERKNVASELRSYLADDRIVPSYLCRILMPYLHEEDPYIPSDLGDQLIPYLSDRKVIDRDLAERLLPLLRHKKAVPEDIARRLAPLLEPHPLLRNLSSYLKSNSDVPHNLAVPCLLAMQAIPHILVDVRGEEATLTVSTDEGNERSKSNALEAEKVIEILGYLKQEHHVDVGTVKILTQYNAQRHLIEKRLQALCFDRGQNIFDRTDSSKLRISTVVSSQGGEWDYVILSTVRSMPSYMIEPNPTHGWCRQNMGFITDRNQVNVALTRARKGLIIVGNVELLQCDEVWRKLVDSYEAEGCLVSDPSQFPPPASPPPPQQPQRPRRPRQPNATDQWQQVTPASSVASIPTLFDAHSVASLDVFD